MSESAVVYTGGCQCGAVRFRAGGLGRATMCHCRICQKAFGSIGALLVTVHDLTWTRGQPAHYRSSSKVRRGFCSACGTPLTFEDGGVEIAMGAFDNPSAIRPTEQLATESKISWADSLPNLPERSPERKADAAAKQAVIQTLQHPDHDTDAWPRR